MTHQSVRLDELRRALGPLPPAAVARIGQRIAQVLQERARADGDLGGHRVHIDEGGQVHLEDGPRIVDPRMRSPERGLEGAASAVDDLWALGVLLADAALGQAAHLSSDGTLLFDRALFPQRFVDALAVLVAPVGARVTRSAAAARIFFELEPRLGDGQAMLRDAVRRFRSTPLAAAGVLPGPTTLFDGTMPAPDDVQRMPDPPTIRIVDADVPLAPGLEPLRDTVDLEASSIEPKTLEMGRDAVLSVEELRCLAVVAEQAVGRRSGPVPSPPSASRARAVHAGDPVDEVVRSGSAVRTTWMIGAIVAVAVLVGLAFVAGMSLD